MPPALVLKPPFLLSPPCESVCLWDGCQQRSPLLQSRLAGCISPTKGTKRREQHFLTFNCTAFLFDVISTPWEELTTQIGKKICNLLCAGSFYDLLITGPGWTAYVPHPIKNTRGADFELGILDAAHVQCTQQAALHRDFVRKYFLSPFTHTQTQKKKNSELCRTMLAVSSNCLIGFLKMNYCQSPSSVISSVSKSS